MSRLTTDEVRELTHEVFRLYLASRVVHESGGSQQDFARKTGIHRGDLSEVLGRKEGRYVTVEHLIKVATSIGPDISKIFSDITHKLTIAVQRKEASPFDEDVVHVNVHGKDVVMPKAIADSMRARKPGAVQSAPDTPQFRPRRKRSTRDPDPQS